MSITRTRSHRLRISLIVFSLVSALLAVSQGVDAPVAAGDTATLISFEESIPSPGNVTSQYCNSPVSNKGVRFLDPVRLIEPAVGTMTPTHAATNHFVGDEFTEPNIIRITFTADQSFVSVRAGLDRAYSFPVTAKLRAYSTATPSPGSLLGGGGDSVFLGSVATTINHHLYVSSDGAAQPIRSIEIEFVGPSPGNAAFEVFDNLMYPTLGPPCVSDTTNPMVQIVEPAPGTPFYGAPTGGNVPLSLRFRAVDDQTGVASVLVEYRDSDQYVDLDTSLLESFWVCGGGNVPACAAPSTTVDRNFQSFMPPGTVFVRVLAQDFAGNEGSDGRRVTITPSTANVWAQGLEITQATQPWVAENTNTRRALATGPPTFAYPAVPISVPLVANRTTVARLFVGVEGTVDNGALPEVGGALRCYTESSYTLVCPGPSEIYAEHQPPNTTKTITVDPAHALIDQRRQSHRTLNFVLPAEWTAAGVIHLEAEVKSPIPECDGCTDAANTIRVRSIPFRGVPDWNRMIVQVLVDRSGLGTATSAQREANLDYVRSILPIDESTVGNGWRIMPYLSFVLPGLNPDASELLDDLESQYGHMLDDHDYKVVWALTDSNPPGWQSLGRIGAGLATSNGGGRNGPHEIGHGLGLLHPGPAPGHGDECKDPAWCETDWPWLDGGIGHFGYDVFDFEVHDPGNPPDGLHDNDFMSYGDPEWISPRNWIRMFNAFTGWSFPYPKATSTTTLTAAATSATPLEDAAVPHLLVRARWDPDAAAWMLLPIYEIARTAAAPVTEDPDLLLDLLDGEGGVLATERIDLRDNDHIDTDDPNVVEVPDPSFVRFAAMPAGTDRVTLGDGDTLFASRARSEHSPTVAIADPTTATGFDGTIRWTWSDADGDSLFAMVDYRQAADALWQPLAIDHEDDVLTADPGLLPGGVAAQVRVTVTDGFNTVEALSEPFTIADKAPTVEVLLPAEDAVFEAGRRVVLRGNGADLEDEALPAGSLEWSSDRDGALGTGTRLDVAGLSAGPHTLTLTGTDSAGNSGSATVTVQVDAPVLVNHQPVADAGPDRFVAAGGTAVLDGSASVDADGDPLTFAWSIVSRPEGATASLDDPNGVTPTLSTDLTGTYEIELEVHDGSVGSLSDRVIVTHDLEPPVMQVVVPAPGIAVQDGVAFTATDVDATSGTVAVWFTVREDDGGDGIPIGLERLDASHDPATDIWVHFFDTLRVPDGFYLVRVTARDAAGNVGVGDPVRFSVRNWSVIDMLPSTKNYNAGRTVPIKFSLNVDGAVDPAMPFVHNEELGVLIYETKRPDDILHEATFGPGARNYRIDDAAEHYITNFKTLRRATQYTVEIRRGDLVIGSFTFATVRGKGG